MKLQIKNPKVILSGIQLEVIKLEFRLLPERIARFSLPYSDMDRLAAHGFRCPGVDAPSIFNGTLSGAAVTGLFSGGRLIGVKHGMRGMAFEIELDNFEIHWERDGEAGNSNGEATEEHEHGDDASDSAPVASESFAIDPAL